MGSKKEPGSKLPKRRQARGDESAAAGDSGRGTLEGPGATVEITQPSPQAPTGEGVGAPKRWKSLSATGPQRSHRVWRRQRLGS